MWNAFAPLYLYILICRSLPCFHTICQKCLRRSFAEKSLACPVCDQVHPAAEGVEKFPHNHYVITYMKITKAVTKCKKHSDRKLSLFCKTVDCQRAICELCLIKEHISHKVVDIAEEEKKKKEAVKVIANELTSELAVARGNLLEAKNRLEEDSLTTLAILKERKKETIKLYNDMIKSVTDQRNTCNQEVEKEVSSIDSEVKLIIDIREGWTGNKTSISLPPDELEEIQQIKKRVHRYLSKGKTFQYYTHNKEKYTPENSEVRLKREKIVVSLSDARNSNSSHKSNEVRPTGTGSFSSRSNDIGDEVRPIGTRRTNSRFNDIRDEFRPIGTGSFSSRFNEKREEVRLTGTGSTSSCRKRDGEKLHRTGSTSLCSSDKRDDVRLTGTRNFSSTWNGILDVHGGAFRLKVCLHVPSPSPCPSPCPSSFYIMPMETGRHLAEWVQNPFCPSNGPFPLA